MSLLYTTANIRAAGIQDNFQSTGILKQSCKTMSETEQSTLVFALFVFQADRHEQAHMLGAHFPAQLATPSHALSCVHRICAGPVRCQGNKI